VSGQGPDEPPALPIAAADVRRLGKVELHVHLEGSFDLERIGSLARAAGEPMPAEPATLFDVGDLGTFLSRLDWWCSLVRTPEQAEEQAFDFAERLGADGVVYAEVTVNPTHWSSLERAVLIEAVARGFDRGASSGGADCRVVVSLARWQDESEARALVDELARSAPARVVGLGVDGNEASTGPTSAKFREAFAEAGRIGLGRSAHAGESSGPDGVAEALDVLGVDRIDHGIRASEDPELLRRLADEGVVLNCCPSSNAALLYGALERVPLAALRAAGVRFTINSDDPVLLGTTLSDELVLASELVGTGLDQVVDWQLVGLGAAFGEPARPQAVGAVLEET
jgi:adenosine deaminase